MARQSLIKNYIHQKLWFSALHSKLCKGATTTSTIWWSLPKYIVMQFVGCLNKSVIISHGYKHGFKMDHHHCNCKKWKPKYGGW